MLHLQEKLREGSKMCRQLLTVPRGEHGRGRCAGSPGSQGTGGQSKAWKDGENGMDGRGRDT